MYIQVYFKYTPNLKPLRVKKNPKTTKKTSENQRLPFPDHSLSVSSTALTIPLTSQTQIPTSLSAPLPPTPAISIFLHFSLPHLLAFPSILGSLPHIAQSSRKPTHVREQTSAQLVEDYFLILAFLQPNPDFIKRQKFLQRRALSLGEGAGGGAQGGTVCPRGFSDAGLRFNPKKAAMASRPPRWGAWSRASG